LNPRRQRSTSTRPQRRPRSRHRRRRWRRSVQSWPSRMPPTSKPCPTSSIGASRACQAKGSIRAQPHAAQSPRPRSPEYPCDQALTLSAPHAPPARASRPYPSHAQAHVLPQRPQLRRASHQGEGRLRLQLDVARSDGAVPRKAGCLTAKVTQPDGTARKDARRRRVRDTATARVVAFSRSQCSEDPARARALYVTLAARAVKVHPGRRHSCGVSCGFHRPPVSPNSPCPTRFTPAPLTYAVCCRRPRVLVPASSPRVLAPTSSCSALAASLAPTSSCRSPPEETPLRCAVEIRV
jgi:hypothetical protein